MRLLLIVVVLGLTGCGDDAASGECRDGETRDCYQGPADTRGIGACHDGLESCANQRWSGICVGDTTPFIEKCNGADDDCNGAVDDAEDTGVSCTGSDGCTGAKACGESGTVTCVSPGKNECGVCAGAAVSGLGQTCANAVCTGTFVCAGDGESAVCNAPQQNACDLCGGPLITGLGDDCTATSGCAGALVCSAAGTATTCSCNPVPGMCKDAGTLRAVDSPGIGDLVITEVMPSPSLVSDTFGEWFEVRVMRDLDLNQVALDRAGDSNAPVVIESANCLRVTAGSTLVFARNADTTMNGGLPPVTATFTFSLIAGTALAPGDVRLLLDSTVIDAITWTGSTTAKSRQLDPDLLDATSNDSPANFCDGATLYNTVDFGTPGAANAQCPLLPTPGSCLDAGAARAISKPAAGALVITELLANPAGTADSSREWFEIANTSGAAFDLNELVIARAGQTGTTVQAAACISIAPGAFALFARSNDPAQNAMLPAVDATFGFSLVDSNGDVEVRDGAVVLDAITWTSVVSGVSRALDPDAFTTTGNDAAGDFCPGTTAYGDGTNLGTPKAANPQCL